MPTTDKESILKDKTNWTNEEEEKLFVYRYNNVPFNIIGMELQRSLDACRHKYNRTDWQNKPYYTKRLELSQKYKEHLKTSTILKSLENKDSKDEENNLKWDLFTGTLADAFSALPKISKPVYKRKPNNKQHESEDVGLMISDMHIGHNHTLEETGNISEYNISIFLDRVNKLKESVEDITNLHSQLYGLPNLHIFCLGDIVAGMNEVGEWSHVFIDTDIMRQFAQGVNALTEMIYYWLGMFDQVHFYGIRGNHGRSLDRNSRILTPCGYKGYNEIRIGDLVGTINIETEQFEWQPVKNLNVYHKKGHMVQALTRTLNMLVTDDHDVLYKSNRSKLLRKIKANNLVRPTSHCIRIPVATLSNNVEYNISDDLLSLLGWIMTDGGYDRRCKAIRIYQSKEEGIEKIKNILDKLELSYTEHQRNRDDPRSILGVWIKTKRIEKYININSCDMTKQIHLLLPNAKEVPSWMYQLSDRQVGVLLNAIVDGDGCKRKEKIRKDGYKRKGRLECVWGNKEFLEKLAGLLISHNISCTVNRHKRKIVKYRNNGSTQEAYYLQIRDSKQYIVRANQFKKVNYDDLAWCVTVDNGTIACITEDGDPFFTGNCSPRGSEKDNANWDILCYMMLEQKFSANERVKFHIPKTWWYQTDIKNHNFLLVHGDDIKGATSQAKAIERFIEKWTQVTGVVPNYTLAGHFHTASELTTPTGRILINGSFIGGDVYSLKTLVSGSKPEQKIFGIHSKRGLTWCYNIDLSYE